MMLAPSRVAGEDHAAAAEDDGKTVQRRRPKARPAGSAEPAEISPEQI
jgi:hypothetical protein